MKDVVVVAGGNSERGPLLRDKLATDRHCVKLCQSKKDFRAAIDQKMVSAILLLFPDEFGIVDEVFKENIISDLAGNAPVVIISTSPTENNRARSAYCTADEFLIEPVSIGEIAKIIDDSIDSRVLSDRSHILATGELVLNKELLTVTWRDKKFRLYPRQAHILEFMMLNPQRPITRAGNNK